MHLSGTVWHGSGMSACQGQTTRRSLCCKLAGAHSLASLRRLTLNSQFSDLRQLRSSSQQTRPQIELRRATRKAITCFFGAAEGCETRPQTYQPTVAKFILTAALTASALCAWCCISARRPASLFASAALASTNPGPRNAGRSAVAGLAAGCLHSLSGPDHLAALTPLTIGRSSAKASLLGAWWGFGHCIGQLILGLLMLILKDKFHNMVPVLDKYSSVTIGLTLILIGVLGLVESLAEKPGVVEVTQQPPPLAAEVAVPLRAENPAVAEALPSSSRSQTGQGFGVWTLATGIVYGLQPDALFVIVPALALPTRLAAAAYMGMFVTGTMAAMGSYTAFIGATSRAIQSRGTWLKVEKLSAAASLVALIMGMTVVFGWRFSIPYISL